MQGQPTGSSVVVTRQAPGEIRGLVLEEVSSASVLRAFLAPHLDRLGLQLVPRQDGEMPRREDTVVDSFDIGRGNSVDTTPILRHGSNPLLAASAKFSVITDPVSRAPVCMPGAPDQVPAAKEWEELTPKARPSVKRDFSEKSVTFSHKRKIVRGKCEPPVTPSRTPQKPAARS
ncbi:hypothetical protein KEM54_004674, partial [Ascosphaera aggregata]